MLGEGEALEGEVCVERMHLGHVSVNIWDVFWTNQVQMRQSVVGRWGVRGGFQMLLGPWFRLGVCNFSVLGSSMRHCSC